MQKTGVQSGNKTLLQSSKGEVGTLASLQNTPSPVKDNPNYPEILLTDQVYSTHRGRAVSTAERLVPQATYLASCKRSFQPSQLVCKCI